jgi:sulfatase maturation enzyme AslB (radical SAM superfamily)
MILSINPTYYCNFRCDFCYLTKEQLGDRLLLPLEILEERLKEVLTYDSIDMVDLYGGEIGILPEEYVENLCSMLSNHGIDDINIITNLSMVNRVILNPNFYVTVSYDFDCREQHDRVWNNMIKLNRNFSILILASKDLIEKNVDEMISQLNLLTNLVSVEIKPYSTNQANEHNVSHKDFELFVQKWLESKIKKNFNFINEQNIIESLQGIRNAFSNDHVYITPHGKFAVLEFDINDREYFKSLDNYEEYLSWARNEPIKNVSDICKDCKYYGKCLTEHYRYVKDLNNGCNGYKGLLDWYAIQQEK